MRKQFNDWLSQLVGNGIQGVIDFDSALTTPSSTGGTTTAVVMRNQMTCDGVHPSYQGVTTLAGVLEGSVAL